MHLSQDKDMLNELKELVQNGRCTIDCPEVINSKFYKKIQTEAELSLGYLRNIDPAVILLIAEIAATSPTLVTVDMTGYKLGVYGPSVAYALSASSTIENIIFHGCDLGKHAPATVGALTNLSSLISLNIRGNHIEGYGPKTANAVTKLTLASIDMEDNKLGEYGPETATNLAKSISLKAVNMSNNLLGKHGLDTADALGSSKYIHKIDFSVNKLDADGPSVASVFAKADKNSKSTFTVDMKGNHQDPEKKAIIKAIADATNEASKQAVYSKMTSFLWANDQIDLAHELHLPKEIACKIAGHIEYCILEFPQN